MTDANETEILLHLTALNNSPSITRLIETGTDVNALDNRQDTPLHYAAEGNAVDAITALIDAGANINQPGYGGRTALFDAIYWNNVEATKLLLECGADVNFRIELADSTACGETPLHTASSYASLEILSLLVDAGADLEIRSVRGKKAIDLAIKKKRIDTVIFLIKCGAEVPDLVDYSHQTDPWAKAEKWYKNVKQSDQRHNEENNEDHTETLCRAIRQGNIQTVTHLLHKRQADLNVLDKHGYAPLHWAAMEGNVKILAALLKNGADLKLPTIKGGPVLTLAVWRFMLNNKRTQKGLPVEKEATLEALRFLLDQGAKVDAVNEAGYSLLHVAAQNGEIEIMQRLLDKGADLDLPDKNGRTPLFHAINKSPHSLDTVKFLIDCEANLNIQDEDGRTPLHWAAINKATKILKILLHAGANRTLKDKTGKTAPLNGKY